MNKDNAVIQEAKVLELLSKLRVVVQIEYLNLSRMDQIISEFVSRFSKLEVFWPVVWQELSKAPAATEQNLLFGIVQMSGDSEEKAQLLQRLLLLEAEEVLEARKKGQSNYSASKTEGADTSTLEGLHQRALDLLISWATQNEKYRKYIDVIPRQVSNETLARLAEYAQKSELELISNTLAQRLRESDKPDAEQGLLRPDTLASIAKALSQTDFREEAIKVLKGKISLKDTPSPVELSEIGACLGTLGEILSAPHALSTLRPYLVDTRAVLREAAVLGLASHLLELEEIQTIFLDMLETDQDPSVAIEVFYALQNADLMNAELSAKLLEDVGRLERWCFELLDEHHELHIQTLKDFLEELLEKAQSLPNFEAPSRTLLDSGKLVTHSPLFGLLLQAEAVQGMGRSEEELANLLQDDSERTRQAALFCVQLEAPNVRRKLLRWYASNEDHPLASEAREVLISTGWEEVNKRAQSTSLWAKRWCAGLTLPSQASGIAEFCVLILEAKRGPCFSIANELLRSSLHRKCVRQIIMRKTFSQFSMERGLVATSLSNLYRQARLDVCEIFDELL